jgi:hypothetical protein
VNTSLLAFSRSRPGDTLLSGFLLRFLSQSTQMLATWLYISHMNIKISVCHYITLRQQSASSMAGPAEIDQTHEPTNITRAVQRRYTISHVRVICRCPTRFHVPKSILLLIIALELESKETFQTIITLYRNVACGPEISTKYPLKKLQEAMLLSLPSHNFLRTTYCYY